MKAFEFKMARKAIASSEYKIRRMEQLHRTIAHWVSCEKSANTARYRDFCRNMQQVYFKRYSYYVKGGQL